MDASNKEDIEKSLSYFIHDEIPNPITDLFDVLYAHEEFKLKYDLMWNYLMESGLLSANKFDVIVNNYKKKIEQIIPLQVEKYSFPESIVNWYIYI